MAGAGGEDTRGLHVERDGVALDRYRLSVSRGPDAGLSFESSALESTIGTDRANDLVLTDPTVSRHHCSISATPRGFLLRDLGSRNGTRIGKQRIEAAYLEIGDQIAIGETILLFEHHAGAVRLPFSGMDAYGAVLGQSAAMRQLFGALEKVAPSSSTVLLEGETGTGKTLLARAIHERSKRADGPFIVLDCATIPPTLIESELFGHEKGAFTGAIDRSTGAFEAASGGTLFLDEIGELPIELQPKLLRALENRVIRRVGATRDQSVDVRIIAATNRDLRREVNRGTFRSDLYYRLNTVRLRVPPLSERPEDIPLLVAHFYAQFLGDDDAEPPAEMIEIFTAREWPGNVRELRAAVERTVLLGEPEVWSALEGGEPRGRITFDPSVAFRVAKEQAIASWEREYLRALMEHAGGNVSLASRTVRMDRNHLRELLQRHQINVPRS